MFVIKLRGWFTDPFSSYQIISWALFTVCLLPIIFGVILLRTDGKPTNELEATTKLVTNGIYRFIRHPLYASLLYLAWGIFFKTPSNLDGCLAGVNTAFLFATAQADEAECREKFGDGYAMYMKNTKISIPFVL
jgi:protein-S-isoprenylcysteine O-methyltransferase Ste14